MTDPAFEPRVTNTVPLPLPAPGTTAANCAPLDAVQLQFGPLAMIPMLPAPPPVLKGLPRLAVFIVMLQGRPS